MAGVPPKSGEAYTLYFGVTSQADTDIFQANPTIAAGDFQVSNDGGATFSNPATLPSVVAGNNKVVQAPLTSGEMTPSTGDAILFAGSDQAGAEWQDILIVLNVTTREIDDLTFPNTSGRGMDVDANGGVEVGAIQNDVITAAAIAADAIDAGAIATGAIDADALATDAVTEIAAGVWDEVLTSATHNIGYSAGQRLRYLILTGSVAQAGSANSITLAASESAVDHIFNENIISIVSGTGLGQTRLIAEYDGTTKIATVDKEWFTTPAAGSVYEILPFSSILVAQHGTAQAAAASSITLSAAASATDDIYIGDTIYISSGTGSGQIRLISAYDGTTKIATISPAWTTTPDTTSVYKVLPVGRSIVDSVNTGAIDANALATDAVTEIAAGVWNRLTSALTTTGSIGKLIVDNLATSGSLAAAVWAYATRTLTQSAASVVSAVAGSVVTVTRGDTLSASLTGLGDISNYTKLWFTIKRDRRDADSASIVQIVLSNPTVATDGLLYLNGAAGTAAQGSITVDDEDDGDITITIDEAATAELEAASCVYDVQVLRSTGAVNTLTEAECDINADITRAVT